MEERKIYARPGGYAYHSKFVCPMLTNGQFEFHGYKEITKEEAKRRKLIACTCNEFNLEGKPLFKRIGGRR